MLFIINMIRKRCVFGWYHSFCYFFKPNKKNCYHFLPTIPTFSKWLRKNVILVLIWCKLQLKQLKFTRTAVIQIFFQSRVTHFILSFPITPQIILKNRQFPFLNHDKGSKTILKTKITTFKVFLFIWCKRTWVCLTS